MNTNIKQDTNSQIKRYIVPALFYDETCPLCLRFKQSLQRIELEEDIHFYPLQESSLYPYFSQFDQSFTMEQAKQEVHLITKDYHFIRGPEVIEYFAKQNSKVRKFAWLIESKMGQKALEVFYKTANSYRDKLRKRCHKCNDN